MTIVIRRVAAVGAAASGLLHLVMLSQGHHLGAALLMAAMAIVCLPCAGHLWRAASMRSWTVIAVMNAAMLATHLGMLTGHASPTAAHSVQLGTGATPDQTTAPELQGAHAHDSWAGAATPIASSEAHAEGLHQLLLPVASGLALLEIMLALLGLALLRRQSTKEGAPRSGPPHLGVLSTPPQRHDVVPEAVSPPRSPPLSPPLSPPAQSPL
ncbi:hypothetical protein [Nesterenkonia sandarakina]|uniref:Uncharacterized protein n=1 Tax=Nesterenkonia sandarakina TaxID=272918 RepID=A0A7Z0J3R0_9MICC|nr:hypothetical protein [Nesterenkonia sandarakina]NYJ17632.1 hypothetical protein [Nesterenkonia sandarakina]